MRKSYVGGTGGDSLGLDVFVKPTKPESWMWFHRPWAPRAAGHAADAPASLPGPLHCALEKTRPCVLGRAGGKGPATAWTFVSGEVLGEVHRHREYDTSGIK